MGKRLVGFRIPGSDQQFCAAGEFGKLLAGEYHNFQFQAIAGVGDLTVQDAAPVMAGLPELRKIGMDAVAGAELHQSGGGIAAGTGRRINSAGVTGIEHQFIVTGG